MCHREKHIHVKRNSMSSNAQSASYVLIMRSILRGKTRRSWMGPCEMDVAKRMLAWPTPRCHSCPGAGNAARCISGCVVLHAMSGVQVLHGEKGFVLSQA